MKGLPLSLVCLVLSLGARAADLAKWSADLESDDFKVRQAAVSAIAAAGDEDPGAVIHRLCGKDSKLGPEARASIPDILKLMFQRQTQGVGEPETGMTLRLYIEASAKEGITRVHPVLEEVAAGSPAEKAGLRKGDVIVSWDGDALEGDDSVIRLKRMLRMAGPGAMAKAGIRRFEIARRPMLKGSGAAETVELQLGPPHAPAPGNVAPEAFAGWLQRMRIEHQLPERYARPQS